MHELSRFFKTKKRFEVAINNSDKVKGMQEYLNRVFVNKFFDTPALPVDSEITIEVLDGKPVPVPYWLDQYKNNGSFRAQFQDGFYEPYKPGEVIRIDGVEYKLIDSHSLDSEIEHQANDGGLVYENRGYSYMRILDPIHN